MADVPNAPGVPALASFAPASALVPATADAPAVTSLFGGAGSAWGVYQGGSPVITADTVASMEYRQEWTISDYPVEQGAFESYDKVQTPFSARVSFAAGGAEASRMALLNSIAAIAGDLNLYDVATPTSTYSSVNVVHYDYRRTTQNGVGLLVVDVWLMEVRVVVGSGSPSAPQSASAAAQENGGAVQAQDATTTQSVQAGTASETAASAQTGADTGYTSVPLPPDRPATLFDSTGTGGRTI